MTPIHVLFVCSRNKRRSLTAERVYGRDPRLRVRSVGTAEAARRRLTGDDVAWADLIVAFEPRHRTRLLGRFADRVGPARLAVLGIPDDHEFMAPELIDEIRAGVESLLAEDHRPDTRPRGAGACH